MEKMNYRTFLMVLFAFSLVITASELAAEVYKTVDKDGNVTFSDQPPGDGTKPMELPPLSVIETPNYEGAAPATVDQDPLVEVEKEVPLRTLRRDYEGFSIISPLQEDSLWGPDGPISIAWNSPSALQEGMKVTIYLNGKRQTTTTQQMVVVAELPRGEHIVTAEIRDSRNRIIATAAPITFYIRQPGLGLGLRNRTGVSPFVGG